MIYIVSNDIGYNEWENVVVADDLDVRWAGVTKYFELPNSSNFLHYENWEDGVKVEEGWIEKARWTA